MGTNYYVKTETKPACPTCGHKEHIEPLHIGKSSGGWQFLFAPYPELGLTSFAAWKVYLADKGIVDEYGRDHTLKALEELVNVKKDGINGFTAPRSAYGNFTDEERKAHNRLDDDGYWFSSTHEFS